MTAIQQQLNELSEQITTVSARLDRLERLSHGGRATYVGDGRVLTKCIIGDMVFGFFVEADDVLITFWFIVSGGYETDVSNFFIRHLRPDSRCVDVGANFGFYTCLMGRIASRGKVVGIEPIDNLCASLAIIST